MSIECLFLDIPGYTVEGSALVGDFAHFNRINYAFGKELPYLG